MAKEIEVRYQGFDELINDVKAQLEGFDDLDYSKPSAKRPVRRPRRR